MTYAIEDASQISSLYWEYDGDDGWRFIVELSFGPRYLFLEDGGDIAMLCQYLGINLITPKDLDLTNQLRERRQLTDNKRLEATVASLKSEISNLRQQLEINRL